MIPETTEFRFRAIDGSHLLGYLAGIGLANVLQRRFRNLRIAWRPEDDRFFPAVRLEEATSRSEIVHDLLAARAEWRHFGDEFPENHRKAFSTLAFQPEVYRDFALVCLDAVPSATAWAAFAGAESAKLSRNGERRFVRSHYYFFSGQQTLTGSVKAIAENVTEQDLDLLFDASPGEVPLRNVMCLRFEPQEVEDHALRFNNPSSD